MGYVDPRAPKRGLDFITLAVLLLAPCAVVARVERGAPPAVGLELPFLAKSLAPAEAAVLHGDLARGGADLAAEQAEAVGGPGAADALAALANELPRVLEGYADSSVDLVGNLNHPWGPPVWSPPRTHRLYPQSSWARFWDIPVHHLLGLLLLISALLVCDYWFVQENVPDLLQPVVWLAVAVAWYLAVTSSTMLEGGESAQWLDGYAYEWIFQIDNLFIFHIIFERYAMPKRFIAKALFVCLCGQMVVRVCFFIGFAQLIRRISFLHYVAGVMLVYGGFVSIFESPEDGAETSDSSVARSFSWCLSSRIQPTWEGCTGSLFTYEGDRLVATKLLSVVAAMLLTDILLGADCAIAKIEEIEHPFWNLSSSAIALFGIRSSYGLIVHLSNEFVYIQAATGVIIMFFGAELIVLDWFPVGSLTSLIVTLAILTISVIASVAKSSCCPDRSDERLLAAKRAAEVDPEDTAEVQADPSG